MNSNQNRETDFLDKEIVQRFQDQFCKAHGIYMMCTDAYANEITERYGTADEIEYIRRYVREKAYVGLVNHLTADSVERTIELETGVPYVKCIGCSIWVGGRPRLIWITVAILIDYLPRENDVPACVNCMTEKSYYGAIEFLEYMSRMMFAIREDQKIAQEAMLSSIATQEKIEHELKRSETMTQILTMLESENGFAKIVDDILRLTCHCLDISSGALIRENIDHETVDMLCEYAQDKEWYCIAEFQGRAKSEVPFYTGKPYMISSDSIKPKEFADFMDGHHVSAAIYQPIEINDEPIMYLCFGMIDTERTWKISDVEFISDVKRIIQSILNKRIAKNSLASSYNSLEAILENVGCGIFVFDPQRRTPLYMNQKYNTLFSNSIKLGKVNELLYADLEYDRKYHNYQEVYIEEEERWIDMSKTQINWVDGRKVTLCTIYDVTDRKIYQKKIESQVNNDCLTGLYNRMRCEQDLDKFIRENQLLQREGALLYIDLDDFKHINEGLGHQYGDVLLKAISNSLKRIKGVEHTCYRMGGDEFIVVIVDTEQYGIENIANQIQEIFEKPWFLKGEDYYCTMSMGIVKFPSDGNTVEDLIRKADMALFDAKKDGKNRIEYYNGDDADLAHRRLDLEKNMRRATLDACREFEVYYQPIIDITKDGDPCIGAEALIRWNSIEMGFVSPADFIPLAEYLGLINPIGDFVLKTAARRCRYWNDMGHPEYKVNVNLSVVQLLQNDIVKKVQRVIEETGVNPKNLTLEVTESLAINDMERMKRILGQMKELGVKVALDDFGTGYSSLNHIREMPIDIIKIDRCFIEHIAEDQFSDAFVKMVGELATTLGVAICTEGVETTEQYEIIKDMRIDMIQGYFFSKPLRVDEFEEKFL